MAATTVFFWSREDSSRREIPELSLTEILAGSDSAGYARAVAAREFTFPADHGPHPRYKTEWWYYTGNFTSTSGERFGFQLTFFRSAIAPTPPAGGSAWRTNQIFMGHFGLTDESTGKFYAFERFSRAAAGLAGALTEPFRVWLEDWVAEAADPNDRGAVPDMRLYAADADVSIGLRAVAAKPPVLQGEEGLSQKGSAAGNASYYYSLTRMTADGAIGLPGRTVDVKGTVWMDREWGTSALEAGQVGWDWFALQLDDGTELMYYQLRRTDGSADGNSSGAYIGKDGEKNRLLSSDVRLEVLDRWRSPRGGVYPARWRLVVGRVRLDVTITPVVSDQELDVSIRYWEGAVDVAGTRAGRRVNGRGYVELTGYAD